MVMESRQASSSALSDLEALRLRVLASTKARKTTENADQAAATDKPEAIDDLGNQSIQQAAEDEREEGEISESESAREPSPTVAPSRLRGSFAELDKPSRQRTSSLRSPPRNRDGTPDREGVRRSSGASSKEDRRLRKRPSEGYMEGERDRDRERERERERRQSGLGTSYDSSKEGENSRRKSGIGGNGTTRSSEKPGRRDRSDSMLSGTKTQETPHSSHPQNGASNEKERSAKERNADFASGISIPPAAGPVSEEVRRSNGSNLALATPASMKTFPSVTLPAPSHPISMPQTPSASELKGLLASLQPEKLVQLIAQLPGFATINELVKLPRATQYESLTKQPAKFTKVLAEYKSLQNIGWPDDALLRMGLEEAILVACKMLSQPSSPRNVSIGSEVARPQPSARLEQPTAAPSTPQSLPSTAQNVIAVSGELSAVSQPSTPKPPAVLQQSTISQPPAAHRSAIVHQSLVAPTQSSPVRQSTSVAVDTQIPITSSTSQGGAFLPSSSIAITTTSQPGDFASNAPLTESQAAVPHPDSPQPIAQNGTFSMNTQIGQLTAEPMEIEQIEPISSIEAPSPMIEEHAETKQEQADDIDALIREVQESVDEDESTDMELDEEDDLIMMMEGDVWRPVAANGRVIRDKPTAAQGGESLAGVNGTSVQIGAGAVSQQGPHGGWDIPGDAGYSSDGMLAYRNPQAFRPNLRHRISAAELNAASTMAPSGPSFITETPGNWTIEFTDEDEEMSDGDEAQTGDGGTASESNQNAAENSRKYQELQEKLKEMQRMIAERQKAKKGGNRAVAGSPIGTPQAPQSPSLPQATTAKGPSSRSEVPGTPAASTDQPQDASNDVSDQQKKELEAEIARLEQDLAAAQRNVTADEAGMSHLRQLVTENETKAASLQKQLAEFQAQMEALRASMTAVEAELTENQQKGQELGGEVAARKKQLIVNGKAVADLQGSINAKRLALVELVKQAKLAAQEREREKEREKVAAQQAGRHGYKRQKVAGGAAGTRSRLPQPGDGDFIELPREQVGEPQRKEAAPVRKGADFSGVTWTEVETTEYSATMSGFAVDGVVCTPSLIREAGFDVNERWASEDHGGQHEQPEAMHQSGFVPYRSSLSRFRSFRITDNFAGNVSSITYSNKVNPYVPICRFELEGGQCFDQGCPAQHFREVGLSDEELVNDLLAYEEAKQRTPEQISALQSRVRVLQSMKRPLPDIVKAIQDDFQKHTGLTDSAAEVNRKRSWVDPEASDRAAGKATNFSEESFSNVPPLSLPSRLPIMLAGIQKALDGQDGGPTRYWQRPPIPDDAAALEREDPHNVPIWITLLTDVLPTPLTAKTLGKPSGEMQKVLVPLSRALVLNRMSPELWHFYLELFSRREEVLEDDVRDQFETALGFLGGDLSLWWRWYLWEGGVNGKIRVLRKLLGVLLDEGRSGGLDGGMRSHAVVCAVVGYVKTLMDAGHGKEGASYLFAFLTARSVEEITDYGLVGGERSLMDLKGYGDCAVGKVLSRKEVTFLWLVYVHVLHFGELPGSVFWAYPHGYFVRDELFAVRWGAKAGREENRERICHVFERVSVVLAQPPREDSEGCRAYAVLLRNYCRFLLFIGKSAEDAEEILDVALDGSPDIPELVDIRATIAEGAGSYETGIAILGEYLEGRPYEWGLWNRWVKLAVRLGDVNGVARVLANCVRGCFEGLEPIAAIATSDIGDVIEETLVLYRRVLALPTPEQTTLDFKADVNRSKLNCNLFLWLNYLILLTVRWGGEEVERNMKAGYETAVEAVGDKDGRGLLWVEYLKAESFHSKEAASPSSSSVNESSKAIIAIFGRAVKDVGWVKEHPYNKGVDLDFMKLRQLKDLRTSHRLLELCLSALPVWKRVGLVEYLKLNVYDLAFNALTAKAYVENNDIKNARHALFEAVKSDPGNEGVWRILVEFETALGNKGPAKRMLEQAKEFLPSGSGVFSDARGLGV
ncbi:Zinc finger C3H1 domain-containing protein [Rhizophlyctis rosea]|nr:Zinc finger C3H1 domain-containing protein [Rhizophlyctis rosea]